VLARCCQPHSFLGTHSHAQQLTVSLLQKACGYCGIEKGQQSIPVPGGIDEDVSVYWCAFGLKP
jgi:wyosine [tRNA(Phe)-imidazoG37] synthetase (radical SAM superfamily)